MAIDSRQRLQEGLKFHRAGDYAAAEGIYREVLAAEPQNADALHLMGALATTVGHPQVAVNLIKAAIAAKPGVANFHNSLGDAFTATKRFVDAMFSYRQAIELKPDYAQALAGLGAILHEQSRDGEALDPLQKAAELKPNLADAHYNLGLALSALSRPADATKSLRKFLALKPDDPAGLTALGAALLRLGENDDAVASLRKAASAAPDRLDTRTHLVSALYAQHKLDEAAAECRKAIEASPDTAALHMNLGLIYLDQHRIDDAIGAFKKASDLQPNSAPALDNLGWAWQKLGRIDQAIENYRKALAIDKSNVSARGHLLVALTYDARQSAEDTFKEHVDWAKNFAEPLAKRSSPHANSPDPNRKLRIGYFSPDFRTHPVASVMTPILAAHDRNYFEIFCYADVAQPDAVTVQLEGMADHWRDIRNMTDSAAAEMIREDRIDVLIDLAGQMPGNRLLVFAHKPAPVQLTYLGYPHSTGLTSIDARITDAASDPPGTTEALHSEGQLIRLEPCALGYLPPAHSPEITDLPALSGGHITFGSIAEFAKVTAPQIATWAEILKESPTAKLIAMAEDRVVSRKRLVALMERHEIADDRFDVVSRRTWSDVFAVLRKIDVVLDSFPCNEGLGCCDALWMGVPVITHAGVAPQSRTGASILSCVGLSDLIAKSADDYASIAYRVANDLPRLVKLREELREKVKTSPLTDAAALAHRLEHAYRDAWKKWCAKHSKTPA